MKRISPTKDCTEESRQLPRAEGGKPDPWRRVNQATHHLSVTLSHSLETGRTGAEGGRDEGVGVVVAWGRRNKQQAQASLDSPPLRKKQETKKVIVASSLSKIKPTFPPHARHMCHQHHQTGRVAQHR